MFQCLVTYNNYLQRLALPTKEGYDFISLEEIIYLKANANYSIAFLSNDSSKNILKSLKSLEKQLEILGFIRIHHEYLINPYHLNKYDKGDGGQVVMADGRRLDVSRGKKKDFLKWAKEKKIV